MHPRKALGEAADRPACLPRAVLSAGRLRDCKRTKSTPQRQLDFPVPSDSRRHVIVDVHSTFANN